MSIADFETRLVEYRALHRKLEAGLPDLPKEADPRQIDARKRALSDRIRFARHDAVPGAFFSSGWQALAKRVLAAVLSGSDGKTVRASIMDENPGVPALVVNQSYPTSVPLSTMPPEVLAALPKLEPDLEYRFIGRRLILLDTDADVILDFTDEILPR